MRDQTPPDPARIAAGLTQDMRDVLLTFSVDGRSSRIVDTREFAILCLDEESEHPLTRRPFPSPTRTLTPLGRAVRAALADARDAATPTDGEDA